MKTDFFPLDFILVCRFAFNEPVILTGISDQEVSMIGWVTMEMEVDSIQRQSAMVE